MINKKEFFGIEESMMYPGKYVLSINDYEGFMLKGTVGSYNVIFSRILNMSYPTFLRFCRDMCGAELIGKNSLYVVPVFERGGRLKQLVNLLNNQANLIIWEREHPDWKEHEQAVKEYEAKIAEGVKENFNNDINN